MLLLMCNIFLVDLFKYVMVLFTAIKIDIIASKTVPILVLLDIACKASPSARLVVKILKQGRGGPIGGDVTCSSSRC